MAYWTKIQGKVKKHDGRKPKLSAMIELMFAVRVGSVPMAECSLYRRDPVKNPTEPDILPAEKQKADRKQFAMELRSLMGTKRASR